MSLPAAASGPCHDQHRDTRNFLLLMWAVAVFSLCLASGIDSLSTDDAMRLVQVRDLLAGQSWFDMTQYRLDPPGGVVTHWSRLVDLPLAVSIKSVSLFASTAVAETFTLIVWPTVLLLVFLAGVARLARELAGHAAARLALVLAVADGAGPAEFPHRRHPSSQCATRVAGLGVGVLHAHAVAATRCRRCGASRRFVGRGWAGNGTGGRGACGCRGFALDRRGRPLQTRDRGLRPCAGGRSDPPRHFDHRARRLSHCPLRRNFDRAGRSACYRRLRSRRSGAAAPQIQ